MFAKLTRIIPLFTCVLLIASQLNGQTAPPLDTLGDSLVAELDSTVEETQDSIVETVLAVPDEEDLVEEGELNDQEVVRFSLESPHHTILSHLYFLQDDSYHPDSAAMTLYVQDPQSEEAQDLAIKLKAYMDGAGYFIDIDDLPQEPNFRDTLNGKFKYMPIPEVPEIFVYKKTGSKNWVYSYSTVKAIPQLHADLFPFGTLDWLPDWSRAKIWGLQLWQFLGIMLYIVVGFLLHRLLTGLISLILKRVLNRYITKEHTADFFQKVARPISLLILFYIIFAFAPALLLPIAVNKWVILAFRIMIPVFWMFILLQCVNLVMAIFEKRAEATETTLDDQLVPLIRRLLHVIVIIAFVLIILSILRVNINALLGGLAFGSLALALAAQDTVKNLFGSLLIIIDRPFQIGDWILVNGHEGVVEEVSMRSTRIRTFAGSLITIPNGVVADSAIDNMGIRQYRRFVTRIGLTYDTPPDLIEVFVEGVRGLILNHPMTRKDAMEVHFNEMADSSLQILVYAFFDVPTWTDELAGKQRLLLGIMRLAETLGVSFAFPTQTLHIENFPEKQSLTPEHPTTKSEATFKVEDFIQKWAQSYKPRDLGSKQEGS